MLKLQSELVPAGSALTTQESIRNHLIAIGAVASVLVLGIGTLGATTKLAGAVVASGSLVVQSSVKKVQHQTGGVVGALLVEEGSRVKAGQILIKLDETVASATLSALTKAYYELQAQRARLEAEADGAAVVVYGQELTSSDDPDAARIMSGEAKLFLHRIVSRTGQKDQMRQRIAQLRNEIDGLKQQLTAKDGERVIVARELVGVKDLFDRKLIQLTRLDALERDNTRISGERGALVAQIAQTEGKIAETELQIIQIDSDMRSDVAKQLADIRSKTSDLVERRIMAADQLSHLEIRAPQDGIVHELAVHAKGAVVTAGETIMLVVPDADRLVVEVRVAPQDIDQVVMDQEATLRFPNFNQRTTPEVTARVSRIAADTTPDTRTGQAFYLVQMAMPFDRHIEETKLKPGMPAEAFIKTSERTILSYLMKPLADQVRRTFREK